MVKITEYEEYSKEELKWKKVHTRKWGIDSIDDARDDEC